MKKYIVLLLAAAALTIRAETVEFRSGRVLSAELSSAPVEISGFNPALYPDMPTQRTYGAVTVMLDRGRGLDIGDYRLEFFGRRIPCVALRTGNGGFQVPEQAVSGDPKEKYTMLFIIDGSRIDGAKDAEFILASTCPPAGLFNKALVFKGRGKTALSRAGSIPVSGVVTEVK